MLKACLWHGRAAEIGPPKAALERPIWCVAHLAGTRGVPAAARSYHLDHPNAVKAHENSPDRL